MRSGASTVRSPWCNPGNLVAAVARPKPTKAPTLQSPGHKTRRGVRGTHPGSHFDYENDKNGPLLPGAEFPRSSRSQSLPENETQIERANVDQLPLQNIFAAT